MLFFRIFLLAIIFVVGVYTFPVVMDYGLLSLFPNFFGEIGQLNWQGQFNLDFFTFQLLSFHLKMTDEQSICSYLRVVSVHTP